MGVDLVLQYYMYEYGTSHCSHVNESYYIEMSRTTYECDMVHVNESSYQVT